MVAQRSAEGMRLGPYQNTEAPKLNSDGSTNVMTIGGAEHLTVLLSGVILDTFKKMKESVCAEISTKFGSMLRAEPVCGKHMGPVACSSGVT